MVVVGWGMGGVMWVMVMEDGRGWSMGDERDGWWVVMRVMVMGGVGVVVGG